MVGTALLSLSVLLTVFLLTLWLIDQCPNFHETIVPKALKRLLCAVIFVPIEY